MTGTCKQLWRMGRGDIGASWTGGDHDDDGGGCCSTSLGARNVALGQDLSISKLLLHVVREDLAKVRDEKRALELRVEGLLRELQEAQMQLALLRREREERLEQEALAVEIWGPRTRKEPDSTWDPAPVLLTGENDPPLSVRRVADELGIKFSRRELQHVGSHVRDAFLRAHGRAPELRVFRGKDGLGERVGYFTERDRPLIASVVRKHELREDDGQGLEPARPAEAGGKS